jgi:hypothetical protein
MLGTPVSIELEQSVTWMAGTGALTPMLGTGGEMNISGTDG